LAKINYKSLIINLHVIFIGGKDMATIMEALGGSNGETIMEVLGGNVGEVISDVIEDTGLEPVTPTPTPSTPVEMENN
jgi:hypothetical protein